MTLFSKLLRLHRKQHAGHIRIGLWGERVAARTLKRKGYRILGQRIRFNKREELDIVARDRHILVFVEVKTRRDEHYARPMMSVNRKKQLSLSRAAARYLSRMKHKPGGFRFDIVEVIGSPEDKDPEIRHIQNAFRTRGDYHLQW